MVILVRRRHLLAAVSFLALLGGMYAVLWNGSAMRRSAAPVSGAIAAGERIYVVDPGHGGEDGGAVAADGTVESAINLEIALRLNDILRFCGQETRMTRREDVSIYSGGAKTLREKKVSDLKNRTAMVNSLPGAVLVSIHQNKLPEVPSVRGAQVFYNAAGGAEDTAKRIQAALNEAVNGKNGKSSKKISDTIYLMKNITAPGILIECGFLSNTAETAALQSPEYQLRLAATIAAGLLQADKNAPAQEGP